MLVLAAAAMMSGCIGVYHVDVQQGNVVTQEMVDKLKPGMTRSQVRFVLGTPLITDPFHPDRWDYYYLYRKGKEPSPETRHLTIVFKDDKLVTISGDVATKESESVPRPGSSLGLPQSGHTAPQPDTAGKELGPGKTQFL